MEYKKSRGLSTNGFCEEVLFYFILFVFSSENVENTIRIILVVKRFSRCGRPRHVPIEPIVACLRWSVSGKEMAAARCKCEAELEGVADILCVLCVCVSSPKNALSTVKAIQYT